MVGLGLFVLLRLLATGGEPLTARLWLDLAFALFFLVRGGLYLSNLRRTPRASAARATRPGGRLASARLPGYRSRSPLSRSASNASDLQPARARPDDHQQ
jgi:hypothetical protein